VTTKILRDHLVGIGMSKRGAAIAARSMAECVESHIRLHGHFHIPGVGSIDVVPNAWLEGPATTTAVTANNPVRVRFLPSRRLQLRLRQERGQ